MIRNAAHSDIPLLLGIGEKFADAAGLAEIAPFDPETMSVTLGNLIDSEMGILLISECGRGTAGGLVHPAYWNASHLTGQELFWWVDPEARGIGMALFDALEGEAKALGAMSWGMIALEAIRPEVTGKIYQRRGYRPTEHAYIKRF